MNKLSRYAPVVTVLITFLFVLQFYKDVVLSPNQYMFSSSGDGIKNYFTYAGHIKESSVINSQLMNWPYGEHCLFLDCQPALSLFLKFATSFFPHIADYSIGIVNFLMLFSIVLSALFVYLILSELKIHWIPAIVSAVSIALLAPQIQRVSGHFSLAYSFVIPLTWYLFIRFSKSSKKLRWSVLLFCNNLFWFFIHAYLGMIIVSFLLLCFIFAFIFYEKSKYKQFQQWLYLFLQTFLPLLLFWLILLITDTHIDRPQNPFGFLFYTSSFESVFLPNHKPLRPLITTDLHQEWEGLAYIGMASIVVFVILIFSNLVKLFTRRTWIGNSAIMSNPILIVALSASFVLLLFSMGFPFKLGMEFLLDWMPAIKNFRGTGRFAWVFYYVITIESIYFIHAIWLSKQKKLIYTILLFLVPLSYLCEGIPTHVEMGTQIHTTPNLFDKRQLPEAISKGLYYMDKNSYQAILPLPFYCIGSDTYTLTGTDKSCCISMLLAYHSGIPIAGNSSGRTSISESRNSIQLLSPNYYKKSIENDLKEDRPFLIIYTHEPLSEYENAVLAQAKELYVTDDYSLYLLPKAALFHNNANEIMAYFNQLKPQLNYNKGFLTTSLDSNTLIYFHSFEDISHPISFSGKGSYCGEVANYNVLAELDTKKIALNKEYVLSFWLYNEEGKVSQDVQNALIFVQTVDSDGHIEWKSQSKAANSMVINGSWSLIEINFSIPYKVRQISVVLKGDHKSKEHFYIDDILIREKDVDIYKIVSMEGERIIELFKNNQHIVSKD